ncbi:MAG: hypothetical protein IPI56_11110 [Elusimicrobia bacterium]|nr:hypothetical protein [Elusimicrobiota bacterium]
MKLFLLILCLALPLGIRAEKLPPVLQESPAEESHKDHENGGEGRHEEGEEHDDQRKEGHEEGEEEASSGVGPGNAVTATDAEKGLQLSDEAVKTLEIKTQAAPEEFTLPKSAIVTFKDETGVYRLRDGWYKLIEGEARPQGVLVRFIPQRKKDLRPGDTIVVEGAPLLRVAELDAFSTGEAGHGH